MDANILISYNNEIKKNFKESNEKNILKNIEQQIEEEKLLISNYKIYDISFYQYNKFILNKDYTYINITGLNDEEKNHILNFFINVNNKAHMFFPSFFHFFYYEKDTNEFVFEKIDKENIILTDFITTYNLTTSQIINIIKVIFEHLYFLNKNYDFTHYNISLKDFLINISSLNISLNPYKYSCLKYCFFKVNEKNYSCVNKKNIKLLLTEKFIKFDRKSLITDIFNIFKEIDLLKNAESFFIKDSNVLTDTQNIYNNNFSFKDFISNNFFVVEEEFNLNLTEENIFNSAKILDYIENNTEENICMDYINDYFKDFKNSYFLKDLKDFCEKSVDMEDIEYLKINFYIFCKLKNYFYSSEKENLNNIYKKYFHFLFDKKILS